MQSPTRFVFALVSLNDPHRFSAILVFIKTLNYLLHMARLKLLTVLMQASCNDLYFYAAGCSTATTTKKLIKPRDLFKVLKHGKFALFPN